MSTVIISTAENGGFVGGLTLHHLTLAASGCENEVPVVCYVQEVVILSLPEFLWFSIEWDAIISGNLLLDCRFCSYFTLLSVLE